MSHYGSSLTNDECKELLKKAGVFMPTVLPYVNVKVYTKKIAGLRK